MQNIPDVLHPLELLHIDIGFTLRETLEISPFATEDVKPISINIEHQEGDNICWAAVTQAVSRAYGQVLTQCEIAKKELYPRYCSQNCCTNVSKTTYKGCDLLWDLAYPLAHHNLLAGSPKLPLSPATLRQEIRNGRPVCFEIEWDGKGRHVAIIGGCTGSDASPSLVIYCSLSAGRFDGTLVGNRISYASKSGTWKQTFLTKPPVQPIA